MSVTTKIKEIKFKDNQPRRVSEKKRGNNVETWIVQPALNSGEDNDIIGKIYNGNKVN